MAEPGPQVPGVPAPPTPSPTADQPEPQAPQQPVQPAQQVVYLNWSLFKPEFSGKSEEDAEAHLLHTNDWMNAYHFIEAVKVQRFFNTVRRS